MTTSSDTMILSRPLLTIAIPTFNRAKRLVFLLESISKELEKVPSHTVEVLISDNASTDDTANVAQRYVLSDGFRYQKNETNLGYDGNVVKLHEAATGEWIWFIGDDDILEDDFLAFFCQKLSTTAADIILVPDRRRSWAKTENVATKLGLRENASGKLYQMLNAWGLFGVLGGVGHSVFRNAKLEGLGLFANEGTSFSHLFALLYSFCNSDAEFLIQSAFVVPDMSADEQVEYEKRWGEDGLWSEGWYNAFKALMVLVVENHLPFEIKPDFFRMMYSQDWPFHFHVYEVLAKKIFSGNYEVSDGEWELLRAFDGLLQSPKYSQLLATLQQGYMQRRAFNQQCLNLVHHPISFYQLLADPI